jgi:hypothetical protein
MKNAFYMEAASDVLNLDVKLVLLEKLINVDVMVVVSDVMNLNAQKVL